MFDPSTSRKCPDETSPRYFGWRVVAACFLMAIAAWGFGFYGHGVYLAELIRSKGWSSSLISGATTFYYLFGALLIVFLNDCVARFGPKYCVLFGIVCFTLSTCLLAFVESPWQLYAAYFVMAFGWAIMSIGGITNILGLWFEAKRGFAISLGLTGASFGAILVVPSLIALIDLFGFTEALLLSTGVMVAILVPVTLLWIDAPAQNIHTRNSNDLTRSDIWTRRRALTSWPFWSVTLPFSLAWLAQAGFLVHQIALLEPVLGRTQAGFAVATTTALSVIGGLTLGTVIDRLNQRIASVVALVVQSMALFAMTLTSEPAFLFLACAAFGVWVRNLITFPSLIIQREFDAASFGMLIGLSTAICQFAFAFGPVVLGLMRDFSGGYFAALILCIVLNLIAASIVIFRPKPVV
jgi:MFS family permease